MRDDFRALKEGLLSTNFCLLPHSFIGDGVTGKTFESGCFLATGKDGASGVVSGSAELMVEILKYSFDVISVFSRTRSYEYNLHLKFNL